MSAWKVKSDPCPPMTLVSAAATKVRLICGARRAWPPGTRPTKRLSCLAARQSASTVSPRGHGP
jgi:hypothetical protein